MARLKKIIPYNRAFHKKHGIKITDDAVTDKTAAELNIIGAMHTVALRKNPNIQELEAAVAKYPHLPIY